MFQQVRRQHVANGGISITLVGIEFLSQGGNLPKNVIDWHKGISYVFIIAGKNGIDNAIAVDVRCIESHRFGGGGPERRIPAVISQDEVFSAIPIEVSAYNLIPPAGRSKRDKGSARIGQFLPVIEKDLYRHPLSD